MSFGRAYIANTTDETISVIDIATKAVIATIPLAVGSAPEGVAAGKKKVYVACTGDRTVTVISTESNTVLSVIPKTNPFEPIGIALTPDEKFVYVSSSADGNIKVIDTSTDTYVAVIPVLAICAGVAVTPDGTYAYIAGLNSHKIKVIRTSDNVLVTSITLLDVPSWITILPNGLFAYVTNVGGYINVIDLSNNTPVATIPSGTSGNGTGICCSADGKFVYMPNFQDNNVLVIDTSNNTVIHTIAVGSNPNGSGIDRNGFLYVTNSSDNTVSIIDTSNNTVVDTIASGQFPEGFGIFTVFVCSTIDISPNSLSDKLKGSLASDTIVASGGDEPYTYSASAGLPGSINAVSGVITYNTSTVGQYNFSITATDSNRCSAIKEYSMKIYRYSKIENFLRCCKKRFLLVKTIMP